MLIASDGMHALEQYSEEIQNDLKSVKKKKKLKLKVKKHDSSIKTREIKLTEEQIKKIEQVASVGGSVREMSFVSGLSYITLNNYLNNNSGFKDRIETLKEAITFRARVTLSKGLGEDPELALKYLKSTKPEEFGGKTTIDFNVNERSNDVRLLNIIEAEVINSSDDEDE